MLSTLEAEGGLPIYVQNTNFSTADFMRLYELNEDSIQLSLNTERGGK